tara:strand:+ start:382 stop:1041 length:660 start_codon:yes stop_codon:yes gene_type:complete
VLFSEIIFLKKSMLNLDTLQKSYQKFGTTMFGLKNSFFSDKEFKEVEQMISKLPYEYVSTGDAGEDNSVEVGRLMTDVENPQVVNNTISNKVLNILNKKEHIDFYKKILKVDKIYLRRAQVNKMHKSSFVGYHLDVDSNPDYLAAVVIQFGKNFSGGEYVVYENKNDKIGLSYPPFYQSMIISNCNYPHEVTKVIDGTRTSLVFFLCSHKDKNLRYKKN